MLKEEWKIIDNYEGKYLISNYGRVKSICIRKIISRNRLSKKKPLILKPHTDKKTSYPKVKLWLRGKGKTHAIHILVWDAFGIKPREGKKLLVDHKDTNRANYILTNLQLLTPGDNIYKRYKDNGKTLPKGISWVKGRQKYLAQSRDKNKKLHTLGWFRSLNEANAVMQKYNSISD